MRCDGYALNQNKQKNQIIIVKEQKINNNNENNTKKAQKSKLKRPMATFNTTAADVLRNATLAADHFERTAAATTTFIVPTTTPTLQLEPFTGVASNSHFVAAAATSGAATSHHHSHQTNSTSSSYTFVQIKREPCQVSEVTTSNNCHHHQHLTTTQQQQQHSNGMSSSSKTTLTTLVKIEASSPKVQEIDKGTIAAAPMASTNNSVPVGIAVARKRPQESGTTIGNSSMPVQQTLNKDMNCYGIRVADIGGVSSGCGNFYFTGNGDLMTGSAHADELALSAAGVQSVNRTPSTFWQYPTVPIESVISMSPATVGLQYQRDASRGQVVLLPATAAALDPFQQAAAAAFVWPSYIPQGTATTALQPPPNFIFPSMSPHSSLQASSYATPLQLLGSNYLTAAAAAAAAAAASSTYCQHNQQQTNSSSSSTSTINLGLGATNNNSAAGSTSSRFLSLAATESKRMHETALPKQQQQLLPLAFPPPTMKIEEWNATEYMATAAAKTLSTTTTLSATTHQNHHIGPPTTALNFERDKTTTTNFLEFQGANSQALNLMRLPTPPTSASIEATTAQLHPQILFQANATSSPTLLNLSASNTAILPRTGNTASTSMTTNFLNNVSTTTFAGSLGAPPTQPGDEALNFKTTTQDAQQQQQFVVGVPRLVGNSAAGSAVGPPPQMQDVNIQTDTPVCSEDENSSCPLAIQNNNIPTSGSATSTTPPPSEIYAHEAEPTQQPLELTMSGVLSVGRLNVEKELQNFNAEAQCHKNEKVGGDDTVETLRINTDHVSNTLYATQEQETATAQEAEQETANANASSSVEPVTETHISQALPPQTAPEDLTGLELLSNISTSSFATKATLSVKQEPVDHSDYHPDYQLETEQLMQNTIYTQQKPLEHNFQNNPVHNPTMCLSNSTVNNVSLLPQTQLTEPLGGLNLLCALAEQRIQEEVQISGSLFNVNTNIHDEQQLIFHQQQPTPSFGLDNDNSQQTDDIDEKIPQPVLNETKRKKHKHSQSSKSAKKSAARYAKKNKKKCAKEKRKSKQMTSQEREMEFDDEDELQEDFKSAFDKVDSSYKRFGKWPNREEIFKAMESDMRMRLAEITRQYRKKKRKLDEISKTKKHKKKALKMSALNAGLVLNVAAGTAATTTSLSCLGNMNVATTSSNNTHSLSASPLCDYKFSKLLTKPSNTTTGSYLSPSNFLRFSDSKPQTQSQFPPAVDVDLNDVSNTPSCSTSSLYKPLRLEPSALAAIDGGRSTPMRSHKHTASEKSSQLMTTPCKERKLMTGRQSSDTSDGASTSKKKSLQSSSIDRELTLTSEHLYRKETRVLTDMGGLFYAGIMKPLQPPDVYAITLDGERGNKSHIMSREEIFKDTIIEVSPSSIESVPVGTRLCAYWSQQYRCLYPGKAIESEASDDGSKNDFVSVEFDDGDSGRIRLQNIRFLLSNYPIVEYDNQLYSLGKQKRSVMKSGNNSEHTQHQESSSAEDQHHPILNESTEMQHNSMEIFSHRSEKKRIKSLKKKSLANSKGASGDIIDGNGRLRKHHKHKKRKKHKKHHHRKTLAAAADGIAYDDDVSAIYSNKKHEQQEALVEDNVLADEEESANESNRAESAELRLEVGNKATARATNFKTDSMTTMPAEATNDVAVKVKTEHLDLEEETTSNMMSEVSDEAKVDDDEIEHNNSKGSKIAAFLPERQLWGWLGKAYRKAGVKGRARKQFYKTIKRGKETITVGDCAVFLSTGRPDRPYIGRIESMWETASSNKVVRVRWFYHPEETSGCPNLKYPGALFESPHEDENDVQTISHRCAVLPFMRYFEKFGSDSKQYQSIYDNNDTYYLSGYYNPRLQVLKLQDDIPTLEEKNTTDE